MSDRTLTREPGSPGAGRIALTVVAWLWVLIPFLYGVISLLGKIGALF